MTLVMAFWPEGRNISRCDGRMWTEPDNYPEIESHHPPVHHDRDRDTGPVVFTTKQYRCVIVE